jgi:hydrogenase-4 component G
MDKPKVGQKYVAAIRNQFGLAVHEESWQAPDQVTVTVDLNTMPAVVESLYYQHGGWLSVVAANDERPINGNFALYYVLSVEGNEQEKAESVENCYMVIRALVPPLQPEFPSVAPIVPAAIWYEREIRDMFGIQPIGLPDERRLVLPDDWPADLYPLRKDTMDYRHRPEPTT